MPDQVIDLTPDQLEQAKQLTAQSQGGQTGQVVDLTPEQQAQARQLSGQFDPLKDFTPQQLVDLEVQAPDHFNLIQEFSSHPEYSKDQAIVQKAIEANRLLKERGFQFSDLPGPTKIAGNVLGFVKGLGKYATTALTQPAKYVGAKAGELLDIATGVPTAVDIEAQKEAQQKVAEMGAGTESAVTELGEQLATAGEKAGRLVRLKKKPSEWTPVESANDFWKEVGKLHQAQAIVSGHGEALTKAGGEVVKELEQSGKPVRPEEVAQLAAGDPLTFWAFGKTFKQLGKLSSKLTPEIVKQAGNALTGDLGEIAATGGGRAVQAAGQIVKGAGAVTKVVGKGAEILGPMYEGAKAIATLSPEHLMYGFGESVTGRALQRFATPMAATGEKVAQFGKQIAGATPIVSNTAQLVKDALETTPGAVGDIGKGAAFDIGMAAATSETPQETQNVGIGTLFGAFGAAKRLGAHIVSGQLIAPRAWGTSIKVPTSGAFPTLDAASANSYKEAAPAVKQRINAVRQFLRGINPNSDLYYFDKPDELKSALISVGVPEDQATQYSEQRGVALTLPDKQGNPRKVSFVTNLDAAPHESFHAFQDVLGEEGNRQLDQLMQQSYTPQEWDAFGKEYASALGWTGQGDWHDYILEKSGWGTDAAKEKLAQVFMDNYTQANGALPTGEEIRKAVSLAWTHLLSEAQDQNPNATPQQIANQAWHGLLDVDSPGAKTAIADRYVARELAAENFDALFKTKGADLSDPKGILPKMARIVAGVTQALGGEPLAGRVSEVRGLPLKSTAIEGIQRALPEIQPSVTSPKATQKAIILPSGGRGLPQTPQDRQAASDEAATLAQSANENVLPGATQSPREILGTISEAIAGGTPVKLNYLSAPEEPAAATTSNRTVRRKMVEIFRNLPQTVRRLWPKTFVPERVLKTKTGQFQILGWAPEVFAANGHKIAEVLNRINFDSPYELDPNTGSFSEKGWTDLYNDVQKAVFNYTHGFTGAGEELVVPKETLQRGFYKPPVTGEAMSLDQRKADFINMLFGFRLPESGRVSGPGLSLAGQEIAGEVGRLVTPVRPRTPFTGPKAEALGVEGKPVLEVNPVRNEIERAAKDAGVEMPSFIEAIQKLNVENIKQVELAPEQPEFRGNTLTLTAGFQPQPTNPKAIKESAVKTDDGKVFTGQLHHDAYLAAMEAGYDEDRMIKDGFVTNDGQFLTREQAYKRALKLKQITESDALAVSRNAGYEPGSVRQGIEAGMFEEKRQFQPMPANPKAIKEAAVRDENGDVFTGAYHGDAMLKAQEAGSPTEYGDFDTGFITNEGEYLNRDQAYRRAAGLNQIKRGSPESNLMRKAGMESTLFEQNRQFQPLPYRPDQKRIEVEGPDGKIYPARFDGYQDFTGIGMGHVAQITPENGFPFQGEAKRSTTYLPTLEEKGYKVKTPLPTPEEWENSRVPEKNLFQQMREGELAAFQPAKKEDFEKPETLIPALSKPGWAIITATQEAKGLGTDPVNVRANKALASQLTQEGKDFLPVKGVYKGVDQGDNFLVTDISPEEALKLGQQYGQESVMVPKGLLYSDGTLQPADPTKTVISPEAEKEDFYSTLPNGLSFSIPIDFNAERTKAQFQPKEKEIDWEPLTKSGKSLLAKGFRFIDRSNDIYGNNFNITLLDAKGNKIGDADAEMIEGTNEGRLVWLGVEPKYRRQGFGEVLEREISQAMKNVGAKKVSGEIITPESLMLQRKLYKNVLSSHPTGSGYEEIYKMPKANFQPAKSKDEYKFTRAPGGISKAWILPSGRIEQLGGQWHHDWLDQNKEIQSKYGLQIPPFEGGDTEGVREAALKKGFVRVNLDTNNGIFTAELREKDWKSHRAQIEDLIDRNLKDIDKIRVYLLNDKVDRINQSLTGNIFDADTNKEKSRMAMDILEGGGQRELARTQFQPPENIKWPAVKFIDDKGEVWMYSAPRHAEAEQKLHDALGYVPHYNLVQDGFVTYDGKFLDREAAYKRAVETGQYAKKSRDNKSLIAEETSGMSPRQFQPKTFIVRHGSTDLNGEANGGKDVIRGWKNVQLNDQGRADAEKAADQLVDSGLTKIYASDLDRTMETAQIIADKTGAEVIPDKRLRPWHFGPSIEGKETEKMMPRIEELVNNPDESPKGGESFNQFKDRFLEAYHEIQSEHPDENVALVTHYRGTHLMDAWRKAGTDNDEVDIQTFLSKGERPPGSVVPVDKTGNEITAQYQPYYSKLEKAIEDKFQGGDTISLLHYLQSPQSGIKKEELTWSGLETFLQDKKRATKQEVLDHLKANAVNLREIVKRKGNRTAEWVYIESDPPRWELHDTEGGQGGPEAIIEQEREGVWAIYRGDSGRRVGSASSLEDAKSRGEDYGPAKNEGSTKFENYQLPGGENYREILFQLPFKQNRFEIQFNQEEADHTGYDVYDVMDKANGFVRYTGDKQSAQQWIEDALKKTSSGFTSSHFDEPNIVAHTRVNDRVDSNGEPGLFVEEFQSDWHQQGRKAGYKISTTTLPKGYAVREATRQNGQAGLVNGFEVVSPSGEVLTWSPEKSKAIEAALSWGLDKVGSVPDAPFKSTWHELLFRRMLQMAAQEGKDWLGWTTGEQQAERYDLSKHITDARWEERAGILSIVRKGSDHYEPIAYSVTKDKLPDYIGKATAQKLIDAEPKQGNDKVHYIGELDLKVGGEGMRGFYDKIIVDYANKFGKQFGVRVKDRRLRQGRLVHSIDITPKMKSSLKEGIAMFQPGTTTTQTPTIEPRFSAVPPIKRRKEPKLKDSIQKPVVEPRKLKHY